MDEAVLGALAEARALGFLGPGPLESHVASADAFAAALGPLAAGSRALDLGSGGGVPGLLLAARFPAVRWTLLDQHRRRTSFLSRTVATLGWVGQVEVVRSAAEVAAHTTELRGSFDAVVSRSFGPPAVTAEVAAGFLILGGRLVVAEPPVPDPDRWPAEGLRRLGLTPMEAPTRATAVLLASAPLAQIYPRSWRDVQRRPLWVSRETSGSP